MKEIECSDFWYQVINYYCDKDEKNLLGELDEDQFDELAIKYEIAILNLRKFLQKAKTKGVQR